MSTKIRSNKTKPPPFNTRSCPSRINPSRRPFRRGSHYLFNHLIARGRDATWRPCVRLPDPRDSRASVRPVVSGRKSGDSVQRPFTQSPADRAIYVHATCDARNSAVQSAGRRVLSTDRRTLRAGLEDSVQILGVEVGACLGEVRLFDRMFLAEGNLSVFKVNVMFEVWSFLGCNLFENCFFFNFSACGVVCR